MIPIPARQLPAAVLCALLTACSSSTPTPSPTPAAQTAKPSVKSFMRPATSTLGGNQAVIEFTSNRLDTNAMGGDAGVGTMAVRVKPTFCAQESQPVGGLKRISAEQRVESLAVPADKPLTVEAFWQSGDQHCFITQRAFTARAGAVYRITQQVNNGAGRCDLRVSQRQPAGDYRHLGLLQTTDQACAFSRR